MKAIMGSVRPTSGDILYEGKSLAGVGTAERVRRGIAPVLEARRLFPRMTVYENLEMGAYTRPRGPEFDEDLARVFTLFPRVEERLRQIAGTLSGGEQQMVAIGRALMARPKLLCMDEPSMGLSPAYVEQVFDIIRTINRQGVTIFMVEQNANMALSIADRAYVLQTGQVVLSGRGCRIARKRADPPRLFGRVETVVSRPFVARCTQSKRRSDGYSRRRVPGVWPAELAGVRWTRSSGDADRSLPCLVRALDATAAADRCTKPRPRGANFRVTLARRRRRSLQHRLSLSGGRSIGSST